MIKRIKFTDDSEGICVWNFITEIQIKYGETTEVYSRGILRDRRESISHTAVLDNAFYEIIHDNKMVACVYARRDNFNHTEVTLMECEVKQLKQEQQ